MTGQTALSDHPRVGNRPLVGALVIGFALGLSSPALADSYTLLVEIGGFKTQPNAAAVSSAGKGSVYTTVANSALPAGTTEVRFTTVVAPSAGTPVDDNHDFFIAQSALDNDTRLRAGFAFGTIVVPFKLQLQGGASLRAGGTIGPYIGVAHGIGESETLTIPFFAGLATIPTKGAPSTTTPDISAGLSYGSGIIFDLKQVQVGAIVGWDWGNSSAAAYNNKLWLSFSMGFTFK